MKNSKNLTMLAVVAHGLHDLKDRVVFVGGATVDLYITLPGGAPLRTTDDVDCVVEITSRIKYQHLEEQLRKLGFVPVVEGPICRWRFNGILVDVMPTDERLLGFSNRWYSDGIVHAKSQRLVDGIEIAYFSLPYFIASKIEAFFGRGRDDFYGSHDLEDIVAVIDGVENFADEILSAPKPVKDYLISKFGGFLDRDDFIESLPGHLGPAGSGRADRVLREIRQIVGRPNST